MEADAARFNGERNQVLAGSGRAGAGTGCPAGTLRLQVPYEATHQGTVGRVPLISVKPRLRKYTSFFRVENFKTDVLLDWVNIDLFENFALAHIGS